MGLARFWLPRVNFLRSVYFPVAIYWPSAGIHSLLIYTLTILLFVRNSEFRLRSAVVRNALAKLSFLYENPSRVPFLKRQVVNDALEVAQEFSFRLMRLTPYYVVVALGAIGTFVANALRIATISWIGLQVGSVAAQYFHDYWGELFFIIGMFMYIAILFFGSRLVSKLGGLRRKPRF